VTETEKTILALVIENPRLVDVLLANCSEEIFGGVKNQEIFRAVQRFYSEGTSFDWAMIMDSLRGKVQEIYFTGMLETIRQIPDSLAEAKLKEKILVLKERQTKKLILKEIDEQTRFKPIDFDEIIHLAERGKFVGLIKEEPAFEVAYQNYVTWKNQGTSEIGLGLPRFDRQIDGFHPGEIVGIMGRAATAKTFLAINILHHLIKHTKKKIAFFTLEMSKAAFIERMLQVFYDKSRHALRVERITEQLTIEEFKTLYRDLKIYSRIYSVPEISKIVEKENFEVVFIDYLQLIRQSQGRSLYEKATYTIHEIKTLAKNQGVVIFLLIQISRQGGGGWQPVSIDMCRDSGAIEENCDFLIGIWNPNLAEDATPSWQGKICLKLIKNKRGPIVGIKAFFSKDSGRILEIEENAF